MWKGRQEEFEIRRYHTMLETKDALSIVSRIPTIRTKPIAVLNYHVIRARKFALARARNRRILATGRTYCRMKLLIM